MTETVLSQREGAVLTLTLNQPEKLNVLDEQMCQDLAAAGEAAAADDSVRCVVLQGAGRGFCAGGDIAALSQRFDPDPDTQVAQYSEFVAGYHAAVAPLQGMPKPVLASVHGAAAGGGMSLAMACDMIVAADDAVFAMAYSTLGVSPDGGSTFSLPRIVGMKKAMELAMMGDRIDAQEALDLGIVNWLVPAAELQAETARLAAKLAGRATAALGRTKALLYESSRATLAQQLEAECENFAASTLTEDFKNAAEAFLEKRTPEYKGR